MKFKVILLSLLGGLMLAWFWPLNLETSVSTWYFYDRHSELLYKDSPAYTDQALVPEFLKKALIELEDQDFYIHSGVDLRALTRAAWQNTQSGEVVSGASTITMQLARLNFMPSAKRNIWYKGRQIWLALKLEQQLSKPEILSLYVDQVPLGPGVVGFRHGAKRYFSKSIDQLSLGEMAVLLALVQNPSAFNPIEYPLRSEERRNFILQRLHDSGLMAQSDLDFWLAQPIALNLSFENSITAPHFVFWVKSKLGFLATESADLHIYTTLDKALYEDTLTIVRETIKRQKDAQKISNGAVVVLDESNAVRVMLGSPDFFDDAIDGAVNMATSTRQTGSVLKPFLYAFALDNGFSPAMGLNDTQTIFPDGYLPRNFTIQEENGIVRFREALANSYNIATVDLLNRIGTDPFYFFLQSLGLNLEQTADSLGLSMALGSTETSLLQVTKAFSVFTHQGALTDLTFITNVRDEAGEVLYVPALPTKKKVLSLDSAEWGQHVLSDNEARWKNFSRGNSLELAFPSGAKTGTSQAFRDNWVAGFSPRFTVGVWVGNADGTPMVSSSGMQGAGPIWQKVMQRLHRGLPFKSFDYQGARTVSTDCRRPQRQDCAERVPLFLTLEDQAKVYPTENSGERAFHISYPRDNDVFVAGSDLLIQHRPKAVPIKSYRFNDEIFAGPIYKKLPVGEHLIEVENLDGERRIVQIQVENL